MPETPQNPMSRRDLLKTTSVATAGLLAGSATVRAKSERKKGTDPFRYCLNMSTIRGQDLSVTGEVDVAGKAGYDAIEPWLGKLNDYKKGGGSLKDLRRRIEDHGLTVESAIGFARWIVDDDKQRAKGIEEAKRDMDLLAQLGAKRIAAPPAGARGTVDPMAAAERYRKLLEIGAEIGVVPQIEMWGGNPSIGRVSTAIYIAIEAGHPDACFLGDVYHTYKGGSDFEGLKMLGPQALQHFHWNDYPADPPLDKIGDGDRVYPGDGIAPITDIVKGFLQVGAVPVLSLELFNKKYWAMDPLEAAKVGIEKMKNSVAPAL
ncbi:MAG: sugar phosphate isomerase/epimerase family protein [Verrucomicrobiota bacterium]|nr:sugar phosphate isomerase/epimerase family protein [Verrucomicrobiota bacterium]MDP6251759.1 sugar phosphate isomerase/epimerase family protein [Verrucomicrobiota bacterium]MDP7177546.1 sugar phosphate isomerase/epimerase family protein [Verrucomicrobiota bacterium]MDP7291371.1 sugar phosphate isomerase/epimerase family protein [Verrucomicrobiota bacterium]MDP7441991.1 sugar phosphate isomerase/epimerase family protein [Verrucomicrobiota bacterium]